MRPQEIDDGVAAASFIVQVMLDCQAVLVPRLAQGFSCPFNMLRCRLARQFACTHMTIPRVAQRCRVCSGVTQTNEKGLAAIHEGEGRQESMACAVNDGMRWRLSRWCEKAAGTRRLAGSSSIRVMQRPISAETSDLTLLQVAPKDTSISVGVYLKVRDRQDQIVQVIPD